MNPILFILIIAAVAIAVFWGGIETGRVLEYKKYSEELRIMRETSELAEETKASYDGCRKELDRLMAEVNNEYKILQDTVVRLQEKEVEFDLAGYVKGVKK